MPTPPAITLAIPFYRGHRYLRGAVESVLAQRDGRWRLIVCDDEGPDARVADLLAGYRDPRVGYLPGAGPPGMAANWNRGLAAAGTDLVALPHQDDELLPDYVGRMTEAAARHPTAAVLFCGARIIGPDGKPRFSVPDAVKRVLRPAGGREAVVRGEPGLRAVMRGNFIMCPTMCFRLSQLGGRRFDPRWRQVLDLDLSARLLLAGQTLVGLPDELYAYRRHDGSATADQTRTLVRFREERALFAEVARAAAAKGWRRAAAVARGQAIVKLNLGYCALRDAAGFRWPAAGQKLRLLADMLV